MKVDREKLPKFREIEQTLARANWFLDMVAEKLEVKNDAKLALALGVAPPAPDADQLRADLADMTAQRDTWVLNFENAQFGLGVALSQRDAERLDAQRYRWLRSHKIDSCEPVDYAKFDADLDAAMAAPKLATLICKSCGTDRLTSPCTTLENCALKGMT